MVGGRGGAMVQTELRFGGGEAEGRAEVDLFREGFIYFSLVFGKKIYYSLTIVPITKSGYLVSCAYNICDHSLLAQYLSLMITNNIILYQFSINLIEKYKGSTFVTTVSEHRVPSKLLAATFSQRLANALSYFIVQTRKFPYDSVFASLYRTLDI